MSRSSRFWWLLAAAVIAVTVAIGGAGSEGPPLDPRSVSPGGARGIVEVLERLGAGVELDDAVPAADATSALLLRDRLSAEDRRRLESWVRAGGTLVVADPSSRLAAATNGLAAAELAPGACSIDALSTATSISGRGRTFVPEPGGGCFGSAERPYVTVRPLRDGLIVSVGGAGAFTNEHVARLDNAWFAVSLLAPDPDRARVVIVAPSTAEFGQGSIENRVAPRVRNAIIMALASFVVYALFRMRRLGAVVREPLPVEIRGSELVLKAGVLSERADDPAGAADVIRTDFLERWRRRLAAPGADAATIVGQLRARHGVDGAELERALLSPIASDHDLVDAVAILDRVAPETLTAPKGTS